MLGPLSDILQVVYVTKQELLNSLLQEVSISSQPCLVQAEFRKDHRGSTETLDLRQNITHNKSNHAAQVIKGWQMTEVPMSWG